MPNSSITTTLVDTDPISSPRYAGICSIVRRRHVDRHAVAQLHHVLRGERLGVLDALFHIVLPQAVDLQNRALARLLGLQHGRADGAAPGVLRGHEQLLRRQRERLAQRPHHARRSATPRRSAPPAPPPAAP